MADTTFDKYRLDAKCTALSDAATVALATNSLEQDEHSTAEMAKGLPMKLTPARTLAVKLAIFSEHARQLAVCAQTADIILPHLGLKLNEAVEQAQRAFATSKSDKEGDKSVIPFLSTQSRLFVFGTQLLTMNDEQEQKAKLDCEDGRAIFEAASAASRAVINESSPN